MILVIKMFFGFFNQMCELGANCPHRHEHQRTSEFAHPGDVDEAPHRGPVESEL